MKIIYIKKNFVLIVLLCLININIATTDTPLCENCKKQNSKSLIEYSLDYLNTIKEITKKKLLDTTSTVQDKVKQKFAHALVIVFEYVDLFKEKFHSGVNTVKENIDKVHRWAEKNNNEST